MIGQLGLYKRWLDQSIRGSENLLSLKRTKANASFLISRITKARTDLELKKDFRTNTCYNFLLNDFLSYRGLQERVEKQSKKIPMEKFMHVHALCVKKAVVYQAFFIEKEYILILAIKL